MISAPRVLILVCVVAGIEAQFPISIFRPPLNLTNFVNPAFGNNFFRPPLNLTALAQYFGNLQNRPIPSQSLSSIIAQYFGGGRPQTTTTASITVRPPAQVAVGAPAVGQGVVNTRDSPVPVTYQRFIQTNPNLPANTTLLSFYPLVTLLGAAGGNGIQG